MSCIGKKIVLAISIFALLMGCATLLGFSLRNAPFSDSYLAAALLYGAMLVFVIRKHYLIPFAALTSGMQIFSRTIQMFLLPDVFDSLKQTWLLYQFLALAFLPLILWGGVMKWRNISLDQARCKSFDKLN